MRLLVGDEYGKVRCPVCGTEYDDSVIACPKCGSMSLEKREEELVKKEGRPITLPPPVQRPPPTFSAGPVPPPPPPANGPSYAQPGYAQQYPPSTPLFLRQGVSPYGFQPARQQPNPVALGLGITGIMLGMGGMMLGILGAILGYSVCGFIGIFLCVISIVLGIVLLKMDTKMALGSLVLGIMGLMMTLLMVGIFWWIETLP